MLRFNEATRQSVARVHAAGAGRPAEAAGHAAAAAQGAGHAAAGSGHAAGAAEHSAEAESAAAGGAPVWNADPRCLAFEYTKTIAAAGEHAADLAHVGWCLTPLSSSGATPQTCSHSYSS